MAAEQSSVSGPQPPPLDPSLILRARAALNAAGLPGDAIGDEEVAGLVHDVGQFTHRMSLANWWDLENWRLDGDSPRPAGTPPDRDVSEERIRRVRDAMGLITDDLPPTDLVRKWLTYDESHVDTGADTLQDWAANHVPWDWLTGIGVIDAAIAMADGDR